MYRKLLLQTYSDSYSCLSAHENATEHCCSEYIYQSEIFEETIVTEFDLVCDKSYLNRLVQSFGLLGLLFGAIGLGSLADHIGRRKTLLVSALGASSMSIAVAFSNDLISFSILRFLAGGFIHGAIPVTLIYALEFIGPEYRGWVGPGSYLLFDIGLASLSLVAYFWPEWRAMSIAIALLPLPFIPMFFFIPESIQYLFSKYVFIIMSMLHNFSEIEMPKPKV